MPTSGGDQKATITDLDANASVEVQFNPSELQLADGARWRAQGNTTRPSLSYESGEPATLRLELTFDATRGGGDVEADHVRPLRAFLERGERKSSEGRAVARPPYLQFSWGVFTFVGVLAKLEVRYTMFKPDGTPVRAKATLSLTEHAGDEIVPASTSEPAKSVVTATLGPGQTLSQVALRSGTTTADLARANGVADPLDVEPGMTLAVPSSPAIADAMERAIRAVVPASWGGVALDGALEEAGEGLLRALATEALAALDEAVDRLGLPSQIGDDVDALAAATLGDLAPTGA